QGESRLALLDTNDFVVDRQGCRRHCSLLWTRGGDDAISPGSQCVSCITTVRQGASGFTRSSVIRKRPSRVRSYEPPSASGPLEKCSGNSAVGTDGRSSPSATSIFTAMSRFVLGSM